MNAELLRSQRLEQNVLHDMCYSVVLWDWIFFNQSHGQAVTTDHLRIQKRSKNKSPAIALFLFVGYILSFVIRFIVNAPDSLLIKHELDLEGFEHQDSPDYTGGLSMVRLCTNSCQKNRSISKRNAYESNPPCSDQIRYLGMRK